MKTEREKAELARLITRFLAYFSFGTAALFFTPHLSNFIINFSNNMRDGWLKFCIQNASNPSVCVVPPRAEVMFNNDILTQSAVFTSIALLGGLTNLLVSKLCEVYLKRF